jgi:membrane dipeptidase
LEDVSKYPDLIKALLETKRWSDEDLEKLTGKNLLRVFRDVEKVRDSMQEGEPDQDAMKLEELEAHNVNRDCITATFERLTPEERRVQSEQPQGNGTGEL